MASKMPEGDKHESWWSKKTKLERALLCVVIISVFVVITLVVLLFALPKEAISTGEVCDSQPCITEALKILSYIDTTVDPCEDFLAFTCNKANLNEQQDFGEQGFLELADMYSEPIQKDDHRMAKVEKAMYQACMNETAIQAYAFNTVRQVLKAAGGWPVVEGENWTDANSSWLQVMYRLRELGYTYSSLLRLDIVADRESENKYIFEVSIPRIPDIYNYLFDSDDTGSFMAQVAITFGAESNRAIAEMNKTYQFLLDLQSKRTDMIEYEVPQRVTVAEFEKKHGEINWLQFINTIAGPGARITKKDYVLFPSKRNLDVWFDLLFRTSERVRVNYILWRAVEDTLPHLTDELKRRGFNPRLTKEATPYTAVRSRQCVEELQRKFDPSPINVRYLRKIIPKSRKENLEKLLMEIITEFPAVLNHFKWMEAARRQEIENSVNNVTLFVASSVDYYDDGAFDDTHFHLASSKSSNFLNMLGQVSRIYQNQQYNLIRTSRHSRKLAFDNILPFWAPFHIGENEIILSAEDFRFFNDQLPNYLNYGRAGIALNMYAWDWPDNNDDAFLKQLQCFSHKSKINRTALANFVNDFDRSYATGMKTANMAYKNWIKNNREEFPLIASKYTAEELFWISAGINICAYSETDDSLKLIFQQGLTPVISKTMGAYVDMARDFNCPVKDNCKEP